MRDALCEYYGEPCEVNMNNNNNSHHEYQPISSLKDVITKRIDYLQRAEEGIDLLDKQERAITRAYQDRAFRREVMRIVNAYVDFKVTQQYIEEDQTSWSR